ncbi:MAG TPA: hypothetical protein VF754_04760, partial [Pyrinomonadaceae bacterium]
MTGFAASGQTCFLRLTSRARRPLEQVAAELDFVGYLSRGGVKVCLPLKSRSGETIEVIGGAGGPFYACVFEEAAGHSFDFGAEEFNERHFRL